MSGPLAADGFSVRRIDGALRLVGTDDARGLCLDVDDVRRRLRQGRRLALAKACGVGPEPPRVLDAMAGFGLDGITLACLGCRVTLVERHPLLAELLTDAVERVRRAVDMAAIDVRCCDARAVLDEGRAFDCIYLDPMFPERDKTALPRRSAQMLARLVGPPDDDLDEFVRRAISLATRRVVVKRRRHDVAAASADWEIVGRSVRFDVYRGRAPARS
ncbi:MAG TPA: class I SAM-dependent methyltransferase [Pseudomonadales bacterium]|nr:class I SAM-dependent methyltransferase [Pseudomonadales bacterium]